VIDAARRAFQLPDLRQKIIFTFAMLAVYRLVAHVPIPGVNQEALRQLVEGNQLLGLLSLFSGGSLETFSIAALGVYPYITAQIVMQILTPVIPRLAELSKEGEAGRTRLSQYTRILTVPLALLQAYAQATLLAREGIITNFGLFDRTTFLPTVSLCLTLTAGTMFLVWLGELITEKGIGNGISLIIFAGIVARLPALVAQQFVAGSNWIGLALLGIIGLGIILAIVYMNEGQRRITVHYAKRIRGNRQYGGTTTYIPLRVNSAGMIPLIFAMSIMLIPATVATYFQGSETEWVRNVANTVVTLFGTTSPFYWFLYFVLVVGFTYMYTAIIFQQQNLPETLQKQGGFIPGIRAGRPTAEYLSRVLNRITLLGAIFLGTIAVLPFVVGRLTDTTVLTLSTTGILIVVGVVLDTMKQLEAQLMMRRYEGFIK
jgi:preprotein translocase subunit SecY